MNGKLPTYEILDRHFAFLSFPCLRVYFVSHSPLLVHFRFWLYSVSIRKSQTFITSSCTVLS